MVQCRQPNHRESFPVVTEEGCRGSGHYPVGNTKLGVCLVCVSSEADLDCIARDVRTLKAEVTLLFMEDCNMADDIRNRLEAKTVPCYDEAG